MRRQRVYPYGVGGWAPHYGPGGDIKLPKARWFSLALTEQGAIKGVPARAISALELLATTLGLVLLPSPRLGQGTMGTVSATGFTDSLLSSSVATRGMSTTFPLCVFSVELAAQLEARGAELLLDWIPREVNSEADRLAECDTRGFDPELRVHADVRQLKWLVLNRLMEAGAAFHRLSAGHLGKGSRGMVQKQAAHHVKRRKALREREPW